MARAPIVQLVARALLTAPSARSALKESTVRLSQRWKHVRNAHQERSQTQDRANANRAMLPGHTAPMGAAVSLAQVDESRAVM